MSARRSLILVTGASGFVGQALCARLAIAGLDVLAVSRQPSHIDNRVRTLVVDNYALLANMPEVLAAAVAIIHLADRSHRKSYTGHNYAEAAEVVEQLAAAAGNAGVERFLFASSIYADHPEKTLYGRSKLAAELALARSAAPFAAAVSLRLPPIYGDGAAGMFGALSDQIAKERPLPLGRAVAPRRFLGIDNLGSLVLSFCRDSNAGGIYSPADPEPISLKNLALEMSRIGGKRLRLFSVPFIDRLSTETIVEPAVARREADRVARDLAWRPEFTLGEQLGYLS
ncbi:NAD-dependent epimerase/dehydratase family protein [Leptolyngbya sp. 15MV]|nr:NAD-dependent epimerase/dehydratase family protein [Leptolyngbya sp. 15MV]